MGEAGARVGTQLLEPRKPLEAPPAVVQVRPRLGLSMWRVHTRVSAFCLSVAVTTLPPIQWLQSHTFTIL